MLIAFTLSMPSNNSWNGRWSGEEKLYVRVQNIRSLETATLVLASGPYRYSFGDGWVASVSVQQVDAAESRKMRRKSSGFCGYEWMIESIRLHRGIYLDAESAAAALKKREEAQA